MVRPVNRMRPVHPGEVLREDYLLPLGLSVNALSATLGVPATRIHEIVKNDGPLQPTRLRDLPSISAGMQFRGWSCRLITI